MPVPSKITALAQELGLGGSPTRHVRELNALWRVLGGASAVLSLIFAAGALSSAGWAWGAVACALVCGAVLALRRRAFFLYPEGIVVTGVFGGVTFATRWETATLFWDRDRFDDYRLVAPGVGVFRLRERPARAASTNLRAHFTAAKLPGVVERLHAGERVPFAAVTAAAEGLWIGPDLFAWTDSVFWTDHWVLDATSVLGLEARRPLGLIPDVPLLIRLISDAATDPAFLTHRQTAA